MSEKATQYNPRTMESYMMVNGQSGDTFYSDKPDRHITASASTYGRKVKTERMILIKAGVGELTEDTVIGKYITKVTIIE